MRSLLFYLNHHSLYFCFANLQWWQKIVIAGRLNIQISFGHPHSNIWSLPFYELSPVCHSIDFHLLIPFVHCFRQLNSPTIKCAAALLPVTYSASLNSYEWILTNVINFFIVVLTLFFYWYIELKFCEWGGCWLVHTYVLCSRLLDEDGKCAVCDLTANGKRDFH